MSDELNSLAETSFSGQRTLAAIVFTDTVSFSALAAKNEEHTLQLVGRDLERMKSLCQASGGYTIKSTGDGLLMLFHSAVQAVSCALDIQRDLHQSGLSLAPEDRLMHRVGIHLGDVFINGSDVMGDGVNVAARLQSEADPGGICVSATVYDVVNNRVKFHINEQVERKLKNIGKMKAYQISPPEGGLNSPKGGGTPPPRKKGSVKIPWLTIGGSVAGILIILGGMAKYAKNHAHASPTPKPAVTLADVTPTEVPTTAPTPIPQPTTAPAPTVDTETLNKELEAARSKYLTVYDFKGFKKWLQGHMGDDSHPAYKMRTDLYAKGIDGLIHLYDWWKPTFKAHYNAEHPVHVHPTLVGDKYYFYPSPLDSITVVKNNELPKTMAYSQIPPIGLAAVIRTVILEQTSTTEFLSTHNAQEKNVLENELGVFRLTYMLPIRPQASSTPTH